MVTRYYLAVADRRPDEANWSIVFPGLPGVTSVTEDFSSIVHQAKDALASAIEDMVADQEPLPSSVEEDATPDYDRGDFHDPRAFLVPVEVPGRTVRVNVSIDEGLLGRLDDIARRSGVSRSALLARGARLVIADGAGG